MNRLIMGAVLLTWCAGMLAGCATTDQKTPLMNKTAVNTAGGAGEIYLTMSGGEWYETQRIKATPLMRRRASATASSKEGRFTPQKITFVQLKNDTGRTIGKIVKPVYSGDILIGALKQELSAAGYTVRFVQKLPKNVTNGIDISRISAELEQTSGLLALDGTCNLQINVDMWQSGTKVSTHHYASIVSDYSVMAQDQLLFNLITKATQDITGQALPDIFNGIPALRK